MMDDAMIDVMAGDAQLRRRLEAYAATRLTPDPAATSRIRARVLATAHRRADLRHADAGLAVLPEPGSPMADVVERRRPRRRSPWRRALPAVLAAALTLTAVAGTALAARPGGALYDARLWLESLTLPSTPTERAVAELHRLDARLREAVAASAAGDAAAVAAALTAYAAIVDEASAGALLSGDEVASAALSAGVARNVAVLQALAGTVPDRAGEAISRAIERAIARSDATIDAIGPSGGRGGGGSDGGGTVPPPATDERTPKPTKDADPKPTKEPKPTAEPTPEPAAVPTPRPTPGRTPPAHGRPDAPGPNPGGD